MRPLILAGSLAAILALGTGAGAAAEPPTSVTVAVPDYVVARAGAQDIVTLPGGAALLEEGRPQVPYYPTTISYPGDCRIQDVRMKSRSGMKTAAGLDLPITHPDSGAVGTRAGVFPPRDYDWRAFADPDGRTRLLIYVYPFRYDPTTRQATFYQNYEFEVRYVRTSVRIEAVGTDKAVYDPGEKVMLGLRLANSGPAQAVAVAATVSKAFTSQPVATLPGRNITRLGRADSVSLVWPTTGFPSGDYALDAIVRDKDGNELGREQVIVQLGAPRGEVTDLAVRPALFRIGDVLELSFQLKNTGTGDLAGDGVFRIMKGSELIAEIVRPFGPLAPGSATLVRGSWSTAPAEKATLYRVIGYATYAGTSSRAQSALASTNSLPTARFTFAPATPAPGQAVAFDATASSDRDGRIVTYRWEFDDGSTAPDSTATHRFLDGGDYRVRLVVTDNEGGIGTAVQTITIPR